MVISEKDHYFENLSQVTKQHKTAEDEVKVPIIVFIYNIMWCILMDQWLEYCTTNQ